MPDRQAIEDFALKLPPELREEFRRIMDRQQPIVIHDDWRYRPLGGIRPGNDEGYTPVHFKSDLKMKMKIKIIPIPPEKRRKKEE